MDNLENLASLLDEMIEDNSIALDCFGNQIINNYPEDIISKFDEARRTLRLATAMVQIIDRLVSGYDSEDSFMERWREQVGQLRLQQENQS